MVRKSEDHHPFDKTRRKGVVVSFATDTICGDDRKWGCLTLTMYVAADKFSNRYVPFWPVTVESKGPAAIICSTVSNLPFWSALYCERYTIAFSTGMLALAAHLMYCFCWNAIYQKRCSKWLIPYAAKINMVTRHPAVLPQRTLLPARVESADAKKPL